MGISADKAGSPPSIFKGVIETVHTSSFSVDVRSDTAQRTFYDCPVAGLYMHPDHSGGVYHMPEVGSQCFVMVLPDETTLVLGFQIPETPKKDSSAQSLDSDFVKSFHGEREPMEPGDIFLGTTDDNKVVIRRGGIIQIASTGLAQRLYIPVENIIRDYFQRYQAISPVGEIEWGHATLVAGENPASGIGSLENSDYALEAGKENALKTIEKTPVLVKYNIKDLCQEDVSKGKYSVEVRFGRLTTETLDPEEDIEHVFAQSLYKTGDYRAERPVRPNLATPESVPHEDKMGIRAEEKGILSCTIYCHDEGANRDKVTYAFQVNRDGDSFIFSRGHVHVEVAETVYANIRKGVRIEYGDNGVQQGQSVIELLQSNEMRTQLKAIIHEVIEDMTVNAQGNIKLNADGEVHLGTGADDFVVRKNDLQTFMQTSFQCMTAWGPSGPMLTPFDPSVGSTTVKVKS